jgi:hypothetical protein
VVDLDVARRRPAGERDGAAGVRVVEGAGEDDAPAGARVERGVAEVAAQDVVAGVAAVAVGVGPRLAELLAGVGDRWCGAGRGEGVERGVRAVQVVGSDGVSGGRACLLPEG